MSNILVVEDDAIIAQDIQRSLRRLGYLAPRSAQSGEEALLAVDQIPPDLVLMDITLKGHLDGIQTTSMIRSRRDIPVVYLTAHSDESTLARAKQTGPHGYLLKPFSERDLRTTIEVALGKHHLETRLAERERWFATTLESIGDAVIACDPEERVTFLNSEAQRLTGFSREQALGMKLEEVFRLVDTDGRSLAGPVGSVLREKVSAQSPLGARLFDAQGKLLEIDDSAAPIIDNRGKLLGAVVIFRDVTERRKLEQRLALSERLVSLGTMAAGTAHEINNPLAAVCGNVIFALERLKPVLEAVSASDESGRQLHEAWEALDDAAQAAERVQHIVRDLKKFARVDAEERRPLGLSDVLDAALQITNNQIRHKALLTCEYASTPQIEANEGQLVQVFVNLLLNAAEALDEGRAASNRIRVRTLTDDLGRAVAEIHDTGPGIAAENLQRVFEPFFSTKPVGSGMGLGLSICHSIIRAVDGEITAQSELGHGSVFRVAIPAGRGIATTARPRSPARTPPRRGRVLVIDDEAVIGRTIHRILRDHHDVIVETDASAALSRLATGDSFDLVFCDLMMPNLTGVDLFEAIQEMRPELVERVVFLTGGAFSPRAAEFLESIRGATLAKPFSPDSLRAIACDYVK